MFDGLSLRRPVADCAETTKSGGSRPLPVGDRVPNRAKVSCTTVNPRCRPRYRLSSCCNWPAVSEGRRIHDLRHTAACLWLSKGVDPVTVQAWMGHASIATTNLYLHHLGTSADRAGLDRLNGRGRMGGEHWPDGLESHSGELSPV